MADSSTDCNLSRTFAFQMTMLHRFFAFHLAALMLLTQVGIPVYTHACRGQGKTWVTAFARAKQCCSPAKHHPAAVSRLAAWSQQHSPVIQKAPCCEEQTGVLKMQSAFKPAHEPWGLKMMTPELDVTLPDWPAAYHAPICGPAYASFQPHAPPLPRYGRSLLIFEQTFLC